MSQLGSPLLFGSTNYSKLVALVEFLALINGRVVWKVRLAVFVGLNDAVFDFVDVLLVNIV